MLTKIIISKYTKPGVPNSSFRLSEKLTDKSVKLHIQNANLEQLSFRKNQMIYNMILMILTNKQFKI